MGDKTSRENRVGGSGAGSEGLVSVKSRAPAKEVQTLPVVVIILSVESGFSSVSQAVNKEALRRPSVTRWRVWRRKKLRAAGAHASHIHFNMLMLHSPFSNNPFKPVMLQFVGIFSSLSPPSAHASVRLLPFHCTYYKPSDIINDNRVVNRKCALAVRRNFNRKQLMRVKSCPTLFKTPIVVGWWRVGKPFARLQFQSCTLSRRTKTSIPHVFIHYFLLTLKLTFPFLPVCNYDLQ